MRTDLPAVLSRPSQRRSVILALLWSLVAMVAAASGRWGEIRRPAAGDVVRAGQWVDVTWSALPAEVKEFEVLLSLDDGASFTVRLTPQLDPAIGAYRWRVPNFPATRARLQLRVGIDRHEIEGPLGDAFGIVGETGQPVAGVRWHQGEWWSAGHAWPGPLLEHRPARFSAPTRTTLDVVGALLAHDWTATLGVARKSFQPSSPTRRPVRVAPPVTDQSPLETPQRE